METPKRIVLDIDHFKGVLELTCPDCNAPSKISLENAFAPITCECGLVYYLSETEQKDARKTLEDIRKVQNGSSDPGSLT